MNNVDSTPLAAGGNGRKRGDSAYGTCGGALAPDPRIRQPTPQAEKDEADSNGHQQMRAGLRKGGAADGGAEEHDAVAR